MRIVLLILFFILSSSAHASICKVYAKQEWRTNPNPDTILFDSLKPKASGFWFYEDNKCKNIDSKKVWVFYTWTIFDSQGSQRQQVPTVEIAQIKRGDYCTINGEFKFKGDKKDYHITFIYELINDGHVYPDDLEVPEC
tara:strand:- start:1280 stop:1696 length:417 start_codon:yes stop_codon:yes gene_type:complete